ncbi:PREDICTED: acyl-CoA-binding protein homolog [Ceratosolen solmsi marchali]|uniref:Acyl-CoA-binding protein homolog n=1 Tax=Ceratosolen solmsi marchali TaxID=326594 RepID=A0AAJ6YME3_9HYME|nr:PREDICTED: acyl-CoA-binding protein homolog [Ceratosolen solmsi marchali]
MELVHHDRPAGTDSNDLSADTTDSVLSHAAMSLDQEFEQAAKDVKELASRPCDDELLELYALYKQATVGNCDIPRPGMLDFQGKAKWDHWHSKSELGLSRLDAMRQYVDKVQTLIATIGKKS